MTVAEDMPMNCAERETSGLKEIAPVELRWKQSCYQFYLSFYFYDLTPETGMNKRSLEKTTTTTKRK